MTAHHSATPQSATRSRFQAPKHADRPKQWVHTPWLLLGMLFITALLMASRQVAPIEVGDDLGDPAGYVEVIH